MKRIVKLGFILASTLLFYSAAYSTSVPNTDNPVTFVGPTARLGYTGTINNYTAYNVAGEAGLKNFRVGGTLGWKQDENQRFKLTGEYLWQKITYAFFSGNSNQWVNQGAVGAAYQYNFFDVIYRPEFDLTGYVSHAPSKSLNPVTGILSSGGVMTTFIDNRRIAGSNAAGISPGFALMPWQGGRVGAALNYDNVRYDTRNSTNEDAKGFGGTVLLNQAIMDDVNVGLSAAVRQPFNNYAAYLNWTYRPSPYYGTWLLSLFGDYTVGKNTLPDTYNAGISAIYALDQRCETAPIALNLKGERSLKGEVSLQPISDDLIAWTSDPAVYMPQVLAIIDQQLGACTAGAAPALIGTIPAAIGTPNPLQGTNFNEAVFFSGNNLTFSIVSITPALSDGDFISLTASGVLSYGGTGGGPPPGNGNMINGPYEVVIKAANACGSVLSNPFSVGAAS